MAGCPPLTCEVQMFNDYQCGRDKVISFGTRRLTTNLWGAPQNENIPLDQNCIFLNSDGTFGWKWNRPNPVNMSGQNYAAPIYPSVHVGMDPWGGYQTTKALPKLFSEITALTYDVAYEFVTLPTGEYNFDFDTWLTPTPTPGPNTQRKEVMVSFYDQGYPPEDRYRGDVSDSINTYRYYEMNPDFSAFLIKRPAVSGPQSYRVDMKKLLDFLVQQRRLSGSLYYCQIDLGNEAWKSSGQNRIDMLEIKMNGAAI